MYRLVACADTDTPIPASLAAVVTKHCAQLAPYLDTYRTKYLGTATSWFAAKEPASLPSTVVYAFGGGDLLSAFVPYPHASEITTISLELAGDPRNLAHLDAADLERDLHTFRNQIGLLVANGSNSSINLSNAQRNAIPAQLASHLIGLAAQHARLVSVRYFTIADDGTLHYLDQRDIDADLERGKSLRGNWKSPAFAQSFANVEVRYQTPDAAAGAPPRIFRHIAWNLDDKHLRAQPALLRHLEAKGKVAVLVKGASYLLWLRDFSTMRGYLLDHLAWMVSDSTGIPPRYARAAGMQQDAYGAFHGPIIDKVEGKPEDDDMRALFHHPAGAMPFRFGYLDKDGDAHVILTYPKPAPAAQPHQ